MTHEPLSRVGKPWKLTISILGVRDRRRRWKVLGESNVGYVLGSSLDKDLGDDLGALHLSTSFPITDRVILNRHYAGYRGAIGLAEDHFGPALSVL